MNAYGHIGIMILFAALMVGCGKGTHAPSLNRVEREAIIAAANQAVHKHMTGVSGEQKGTEIARPLWGQAIEKLHPLRVQND